jgi:hypothetical protein
MRTLFYLLFLAGLGLLLLCFNLIRGPISKYQHALLLVRRRSPTPARTEEGSPNTGEARGSFDRPKSWSMT